MRHEDIPEINNPKIRFPVLEGDKLINEVLNGGYNVHPVPPPNSEIKDRIRNRYERDRINIEKLLTLGYTTSPLIDKPMILNSLICKLINVQANMNENNEKKIINCDEISKLINAFPKDIAALDKRSVLAKVNSHGSGR